jgi:hemolysin activation/secretion protein
MLFSRIHLALLAGLLFIGSNEVIAADAGALDQAFKKQIQFENNEAPAESLIKKSEPKPKSTSQSEVLIDVKGFYVTGMTFITNSEAQGALSKFTNASLTLKQINEAANVIVELYKKRGRIAQAIVPPQQIKDGIVEIKVIEGKVGSILIEPAFEQDPPRLLKKVTKKFVSYYNAEGQLINLDGLERSISLINEIPGVNAEVSLEAGQDDGTTNILMKVDELSRVRGSVDVTSYGSASTGYAQILANIGLNDLYGLGDSGNINILKSEGSVFAQARYFMPVGADGFRVGLGASSLTYETLNRFTPVPFNGRSNTVGAYSTYALARSARSNKTLSFNLETRDYNNYTEGVEISKYNIKSATLGLQGNRFLGDAVWSWSLSGLYGQLSIDSASQLDSDQLYAKTEGGYGKLSFYSLINKPMTLKKTNLLLTLNGQLATKNLNSSEQIYLGGPYGVRAYPVSQGGGSEGMTLSAQINHTFENNLELGVFFDAALIRQFKDTYDNWRGLTQAGNGYAVYAAGLDAKYRYKKKAEISGTLAFPLNDNPLFNQRGEALNVDNQNRDVQLWLKGSFFF